MDNTNKRFDEACKKLMKHYGFKTLEELHQHVAASLTDDERAKYFRGIDFLKGADEQLAMTSIIIGIVGSTLFDTLAIGNTGLPNRTGTTSYH